MSNLDSRVHRIENQIPHLVRTQEFMQKLDTYPEPQEASVQTSLRLRRVAFQDVGFGYDSSESVLNGVSFETSQGEFIACIRQSGAGRSTITSLLAQLHEPDAGRILANGRV